MVTVTSKKGKSVTLLTPREKGEKFFRELHGNVKITNDGFAVKDNGRELTDTEKAYRAGYLARGRDNYRCYSYMQKKGKK